MSSDDRRPSRPVTGEPVTLVLRDGRHLRGDALVVPAALSIAVLTAHLDLMPELMGQNGFLAPLYGLLI